MSTSSFGSAVIEPETEFYPCDGFNRVKASSTPGPEVDGSLDTITSNAWGQSSSGWYWRTTTDADTNSSYVKMGVDGTAAYMSVANTNGTLSGIQAAVPANYFSWVYDVPQTVSIRFKFSSHDASSLTIFSPVFSNGEVYFIIEDIFGSTWYTALVADGVQYSYTISYAYDEWYIAKVYLDRGTATKLKVWKDSVGEPTDWLFQDTWFREFDPYSDLRIQWQVQGNATGTTPSATSAETVWLDYIRFDACDPNWEGEIADSPSTPVGITDSFDNRTVASGAGMSDYGTIWDYFAGIGGSANVSGGTLFVNDISSSVRLRLPIVNPTGLDFSVKIGFKVTSGSYVSLDVPYIAIGFETDTSSHWSEFFYEFGARTVGPPINGGVVGLDSDFPNEARGDFQFEIGTAYWIRFEQVYASNISRVRAWKKSDTEPTTWDLELTSLGVGWTQIDRFYILSVGAATALNVEIDSLDISGVN